LSAAGYAMHNMPIGTTFNAPVLSDENAYDVAAYISGQSRGPQKTDLEKDFLCSGSRSRSTRLTVHTPTVSA
jgi:thiosulfate dehydrogenase